MHSNLSQPTHPNAATKCEAPPDAGESPRTYTWVVGQGSSGTKRVFNFFDLSPLTHCHVAHQGAKGSPFESLPCSWATTDHERRILEQRWNVAIEWASERLSRYDHLPPPPKQHFHSVSRTLGLWRLINGRRARRVSGLFLPWVKKPYWPLPRWLGDRQAFQCAPLVIKLNQVPGWVDWVLKNRSEALVVHVVRHPGGYLHAWRGRFESNTDRKRLLLENQKRLYRIAQANSEWSARIGDIERLGLAESELWFWRYTAETIHSAGLLTRGRYALVKDEDVVSNPSAVARRLYQMAELPWSPRIDTWIARQESTWKSKMVPWRRLLSKDDCELVERVMDGSPTEEWWEPCQRVSLFNYVAFA